MQSTTQALDSFIDGWEQKFVNSAKGQTDIQMSEDKQNCDFNFHDETNMQQQEKTEETSAECQFKSGSCGGQDSKLVELRIDERITEIDEKIEKISNECK